VINNLASRILAAIEETEQLARAATSGPWTVDPDRGVFAGVLDRDWVAGTDRVDAEHITRHDPDAVLRRCEADRRTVQCHQPTEDRSGWLPDGSYGPISPACTACGSEDYAEPWPCLDLFDRADAYGINTKESASL
jgi:hypothetical protein